MERPHLQVAGFFRTDKPAYTFLHLARRLVSKGQCQYLPGLHALLQQIGYLVCQHACLAGTGTRYDQ